MSETELLAGSRVDDAADDDFGNDAVVLHLIPGETWFAGLNEHRSRGHQRSGEKTGNQQLRRSHS